MTPETKKTIKNLSGGMHSMTPETKKTIKGVACTATGGQDDIQARAAAENHVWVYGPGAAGV